MDSNIKAFKAMFTATNSLHVTRPPPIYFGIKLVKYLQFHLQEVFINSEMVESDKCLGKKRHFWLFDLFFTLA